MVNPGRLQRSGCLLKIFQRCVDGFDRPGRLIRNLERGLLDDVALEQNGRQVAGTGRKG
jgi:hypothetical protein